MNRWRPYPEYKDSGIEWLGEIPEHWKVKRAKAILARNDGGVWGEDFDDDGVIVLRSTEQTVDGKWNIVEPAKRRLSVTEYTTCRLKAGDLVVTKSSGSSLHIGKTSIVTKEVEALNCCYSNFMQRLRVKQAAAPCFVWYVLNGELGRKQFDYYSSTTTGLANLNRSIIGNIGIAVPPVDEQHTIAAFLDRETARIDGLIAKKQRQIELLQEKRAALISYAVTKGLNLNVKMKDSGIEWLGEIPEGWGLKRLKHLVGLLTQKIDSDEIKVGLENVESATGRYLETDSRFDGNGVQFQAGDILYGKLRPYLAKVLLTEWSGLAVGDFFVLRPKTDVSPEYLQYRLLEPTFTALSDGSTFGAKMPRVGWEFMGDLKFSLPDISDQHAIAAFLDRETTRIDGLIEKVEESIDLLREYRTALISATVTGKIDVRKEVS